MDELARQRLEDEYTRLYDDVITTLQRHDPLGVGTHVRPSEYMPETGTIVPRLRTAESEADALRIVHEEFVHWRGETAGESDRYADIAHELWEARERRLGK